MNQPQPLKVCVGIVVIGALMFLPVLAVLVAIDHLTSWPNGVQSTISGVLGIAAGLPGIFYSIRRWG